MTSKALPHATALPSNLVLMAGAIGIAVACLWVASHATSPLVVLLAAVLFGFANNTIFSFMHEAVHGMFHSNQMVNETAGNIAAAFFPTVFVVQRLSHLTHHKNTEAMSSDSTTTNLATTTCSRWRSGTVSSRDSTGCSFRCSRPSTRCSAV
jgi:fatty acid desaturase